MLDLTPFKFAASLAIGGFAIYATLRLLRLTWRLFAELCEEVTG